MTEAELVAAALATDAAVRRTGASKQPAHDLSATLGEAVRRRLRDSEDGRGIGYGLRILDAYESDPDLWQARMIRVLTNNGADTDEAIVAAARAVLRAEYQWPTRNSSVR
ncbi:hypothetical protein ABZS88_43825 [Streptomyces sp. NPDC005480]|uniref:hypothetical protein n=1 Tax=Streptomyces sp. NPDC005480 TaxID=3154880 RepID=UPI0033B25CEF